MTVDEYRKKYPNCNYCVHRVPGLCTCLATEKKMSEKTAKSCPCYIAKKWPYKTTEQDGAAE